MFLKQYGHRRLYHPDNPTGRNSHRLRTVTYTEGDCEGSRWQSPRVQRIRGSGNSRVYPGDKASCKLRMMNNREDLIVVFKSVLLHRWKAMFNIIKQVKFKGKLC